MLLLWALLSGVAGFDGVRVAFGYGLPPVISWDTSDFKDFTSSSKWSVWLFVSDFSSLSWLTWIYSFNFIQKYSAIFRKINQFNRNNWLTFSSSRSRIIFKCVSFIVHDRSSTNDRTRLNNASSRTLAASLTSRTTSVIIPGVYIPTDCNEKWHSNQYSSTDILTHICYNVLWMDSEKNEKFKWIHIAAEVQ